jgi:hypothetical protein
MIIQTSSSSTDGAIMNRASDRVCWVAMICLGTALGGDGVIQAPADRLRRYD